MSKFRTVSYKATMQEYGQILLQADRYNLNLAQYVKRRLLNPEFFINELKVNNDEKKDEEALKEEKIVISDNNDELVRYKNIIKALREEKKELAAKLEIQIQKYNSKSDEIFEKRFKKDIEYLKTEIKNLKIENKELDEKNDYFERIFKEEGCPDWDEL